MDTIKTIKVARLFPNTLYLHGDKGNCIALERIAKCYGLTLDVTDIGFKTENFNPNEYDLILLPPGEVSSFEELVKWLRPYKEEFDKYIASNKPLLATGTTAGLFAKNIQRRDGSVVEGLGLADYTCTERSAAYGDNIYFTCAFDNAEMECIAIQVQMIDIHSNEKPFATLKYGYGNTGKDRNEGVLVNNAVFTTTLGPLLMLNPWLAEKMILVAAKNKGLDLENININFDIEKKAFESKKKFILNKKTNLTNCL